MTQEIPALPQPAIEYVLDGDSQLRVVEAELAAAEAAGEDARVGELHDRLHILDGYNARIQAARLLRDLGFRCRQ